MKSRIRSLFFGLQYIFKLSYALEKRLFYLNFLFFILTAVFPVVALWLLKLLVDRIVVSRNLADQEVMTYLVLYVLVQVLQAIVQQWGNYLQQKQQNYLQRDISLKVMKKAGEIKFGYFEDPAFFDVLQITQAQSAYLPTQIMQAWQALMQQLFLFGSLAVFLMSVHWGIPLLLLLLSVPMAISRMVFGRKQFELEKTIIPLQRKGIELFRYSTVPVYAKESRLFGFSGYFMDLYKQIQDDILSQRNSLHYLFLRRSVFLTFFEVLMVTIFTIVVVNGSLTGAITIGAMLVYFQAFQRLQGAVASAFRAIVSLHQHQLYLQEVMRFFALDTRETSKSELLYNSPIDQGIHIRNLNFQYPGTDKYVLSDIDMQLPARGIIAIVGENGSGKSTLVKLLCGLYPVEEGEMEMGHTSVNDLSDAWFTENISVLFQDFGRYYLTVRENVTMGFHSPSDDKLTAALDRSTASGFVSGLKHGIHAVLGRTHRRGEELSGGQWQKIAIARALYKDARILILDEPTSSMDPLSEHDFIRQLQTMGQEKLVILITHKLYNLRLTDHIYVFEDGRISEDGKFDELVSRHGVFSRYYSSQKL